MDEAAYKRLCLIYSDIDQLIAKHFPFNAPKHDNEFGILRELNGARRTAGAYINNARIDKGTETL